MRADLNSPTDYRAGVGVVLVNPRGLIFTGKRRDQRDPPWQMPQGGILPDEMPAQAVKREIKEELGVDAVTLIEFRPDWLSYDYPDANTSRRAQNFRGQRHLWFLLRYDGDDRDVKIDTPHGEFIEWRWSLPEEVVDRVISFKQPIYRQVLRYFAPAIGRLALDDAAGQIKTPQRRSRQNRISA